jgi:hypothetical protein
VWVEPPSKISQGLVEYGKKVEAALYAIAGKWGQDVQDETRQDAPWTDRTGNARSGIFYAVDGFGMGTMIGQISAEAKTLMKETSVEQGSANTLVIVVSHTVFYGKFLELKNGGKYAIIMSAIEKNLPRLENLVKSIFKG